eukprot:gb/GECH01007867.1/.p1 GENE.gb/GECH01007867.1/~~gb/GECH01007867.1/.p1  ORF type:complete len:606 (+),score=185.38 gb/GECH01007867.1/:1-1818(+)
MSKFELVILGSGGVGKSAITIQFIQGNFVEKYDPTIEDSYRKDMVVDGESCMLDILDTAGQEEYEGMRDEYMRSGQGFILVYSITDDSSFQDLEDIHSKLLKAKDADGDEVPVVLIGNKCDLEDERKVKESEGKDMAKRFGRYTKFLEASARSRINIDEAFTEMIRLINRIDRGEPPEDEEEEAAAAGADGGGDGEKEGGAGGDSGAGSGGGGGDGSGGDGDGDGGNGDGKKKGKKSGDEGSSSKKKEDGGSGKKDGDAGSSSHSAGGGGKKESGGRNGKRPRRKGKQKTVTEVDASEYMKSMSALPTAAYSPDGSATASPAGAGEGKKSIICYDFDSEKTENLSTSQISEIPDAQEWVSVRWVSMEGPLSQEDAHAVVDRFEIHPVCTDSLLATQVHPQLDMYDNCLHLTAALFVRPDHTSPFHAYPVNIFLFEHAVVTHLNGPAEAFSSVKGQISDANTPVRKNGPSFLLYQILLALADSCGPVADTYRTQLSEIEEEALSMPNTELLKRMYVLRRELILLRKQIQPMITAVADLEQQCNRSAPDDSDGEAVLVDKATRPYMTSIKNKFNNIVEALDTYTDMCDSLNSIKTEAQNGGSKCSVM